MLNRPITRQDYIMRYNKHTYSTCIRMWITTINLFQTNHFTWYRKIHELHIYKQHNITWQSTVISKSITWYRNTYLYTTPYELGPILGRYVHVHCTYTYCRHGFEVHRVLCRRLRSDQCPDKIHAHINCHWWVVICTKI